MIGSTYSAHHYEEYEKTGNKNIFEEIIDKLVSDFLPTEVKEAINKLPLSQKRTAILSFLDKDRNLFLSIKALINSQNFSREDHIKDVIRMLREYVKVGEVEKDKFGEVMTPLELVKEMLATLPEDVWSNPNLKWLDPANGTGPYPAVVIYKLMRGLKNWEPDEKKRYKHIVENMIYVSELQPKNMFLWLCLVDPHDEYICNVYTGSFLDSGFDNHMKNVWGVKKFDIVIGNPPFNQMIDLDFVRKSYEISNKILFVHPSTWLLDEKGKQKKFISIKELVKDHLESIELFNGNKLFNIQLFVPCVITYINKNKSIDGIKCFDRVNETDILYNNIFDINKYSNINVYFPLKNKIFKESLNENLLTNKNKEVGSYYVNISEIRGHVDLKSDINMLKDDFYTTITKDEGVERGKTKKVFFTFKTYIEAENFITYIKTNFARFCLSILKNNSQLNRGELEYIPWLDFTQEWTDYKLYKHFKLRKEEIIFIEENIPKYYKVN